MVSAVVFAAVLAAYVGQTVGFVITPDAAVYADRIERHFFSRTTIHSAYYYTGVLFTSILPLANDYALNVMNCTLGAASSALMYLIALTVLGNRFFALGSALIVAVNYVFIYNSVFAECYVPQVFFLMLALLLWLYGKELFAGIAVALSFLNLPVAAMALPLFFFLRPRARSLLVLVVAFVLSTAGLIAPFIDDFFFGPRGIIAGAARATLSVGGVTKEAKELFFGFSVALPLVFVGLVWSFMEPRLRRWALGVTCLAVATFVLAESTGDVPSQLSTYVLLGLFFGFGYRRLADAGGHLYSTAGGLGAGVSLGVFAAFMIGSRGTNTHVPRTVVVTYLVVAVLVLAMAVLPRVRFRVGLTHGLVVVVICSNAWVSFSMLRSVRNGAIERRASMLEVARVAAPDCLLVTRSDEGHLYERYVLHELSGTRWIHARCLMVADEDNEWCRDTRARWHKALEDRREIWLFNPNLGPVVEELEQEDYRMEHVGAYLRATPRVN